MPWWQYPPETDGLTELRHQRMLLRTLADDIALAGRRLLPAGAPAEWRSEAQRVYLERRWELAALLAGAERSVEEALTAVLARIEVVKARLAAEAADAAAAVAADSMPQAPAQTPARATPGGWSE